MLRFCTVTSSTLQASMAVGSAGVSYSTPGSVGRNASRSLGAGRPLDWACAAIGASPMAPSQQNTATEQRILRIGVSFRTFRVPGRLNRIPSAGRNPSPGRPAAVRSADRGRSATTVSSRKTGAGASAVLIGISGLRLKS